MNLHKNIILSSYRKDKGNGHIAGSLALSIRFDFVRLSPIEIVEEGRNRKERIYMKSLNLTGSIG